MINKASLAGCWLDKDISEAEKKKLSKLATWHLNWSIKTS